VDTAPFGDEANWTTSPTSAVIENGRLFGRGAADSKIAAAIFLVLASELASSQSLHHGTLHLLLDADEHTGEFRGVKEFVRSVDQLPDAVWIGYPGNQAIVAGSRGFLRARLSVAGASAHTGSKRRKGINAVSRAAKLIGVLEGAILPPEPDPDFSFGPSLTVTAVHGGEGYSVVPDLCDVNVDIRLTPSVSATEIREAIELTVRDFDRAFAGPGLTVVAWEESWPPFRVPDDSPAIASLRLAAEQVFGRTIPTTVSGPSNIGNYLASLGVSPMSGFGVTYDNVHGTDEWCDVASVLPVYETYRRAALTFTRSASDGST
jgi:succinyl-diaminopimelate desuccinylase